MKDILIQFLELAKLPKPGKGCLATKQIAVLRQWASIHGKSVCQKTTRNFSTKDKPGTLPINEYKASPPKEKTTDFNALLEDASTDEKKRREHSGKDRKILHTQGTCVLYPQISTSLRRTGKEHSFQRWYKGTVNVKEIADDTIEIKENDYYLF